MNPNRMLHIISILGVLLISSSLLLAQSKSDKSPKKEIRELNKPLVTFVELGSVKCIPCRQMQPVMKAIETKYKGQVKVVFHDVWKDDQREYAEKYEIQVIPTQVFLNRDGREFFRHEGFLPEGEIDSLLQRRGLRQGPGK